MNYAWFEKWHAKRQVNFRLFFQTMRSSCVMFVAAVCIIFNNYSMSPRWIRGGIQGSIEVARSAELAITTRIQQGRME